MIFSRSNVVHQEVIELEAPLELVRDFILTPERILDYYPGPIDGGVIEPGASIYCRGKSGVSLLELNRSESTDQFLVLDVTTATNTRAPFTAERIRAAVFFTMVEDWKLEKTDQGTRLTKTWRDIKKYKLKLLPLGLIVRRSARAETEKLRLAWNDAARNALPDRQN